MSQTLDKIAKLANLVYSREAFWNVSEMVLMPAADETAIDDLSREGPFALPPSYIAFLKIHDGCLNFWPKFALLGTRGEPRDIVRAEVEDARQHQLQFVTTEDGQVTHESLTKFEAPADRSQKFFLPNHIVFGTNRGGEFFMFNERVATAGEYEVVHYTYSGGAYYRYPDFSSFLSATVAKLEQRIKQKGYAKKKQ